MRNLKFVFMIVFVIFLSCCNSKLNSSKVIVYYFHSTFRCFSCVEVEKNTYASLLELFKDELDNNKLYWKPLDVYKDENIHFIDDFKLTDRYVVIAKLENNEVIKHKKLDKIKKYITNKSKLNNYISKEMDNYLD